MPANLTQWIDARKRYHLSHVQVQMARELGMNPRKLGGLANHRQEPWKKPLPEFIETLYRDRFGKDAPENTLSIEDLASRQAQREEQRKQAKTARPNAGLPPSKEQG